MGEGRTGISEDVIREHAYLISRGVRLLAVCGTIDISDQSKIEMRDKLHDAVIETSGTQGVTPIPFAIEDQDIKRVTIGFAAYTWVIDTYEWIKKGGVPTKISCRVMGLLHGYSGGAIAQFETHQTGWRI